MKQNRIIAFVMLSLSTTALAEEIKLPTAKELQIQDLIVRREEVITSMSDEAEDIIDARKRINNFDGRRIGRFFRPMEERQTKYAIESAQKIERMKKELVKLDQQLAKLGYQPVTTARVKSATDKVIAKSGIVNNKAFVRELQNTALVAAEARNLERSLKGSRRIHPDARGLLRSKPKLSAEASHLLPKVIELRKAVAAHAQISTRHLKSLLNRFGSYAAIPIAGLAGKELLDAHLSSSTELDPRVSQNQIRLIQTEGTKSTAAQAPASGSGR